MDINTGTRPAGSEAKRGSPVAVWVRPGLAVQDSSWLDLHSGVLITGLYLLWVQISCCVPREPDIGLSDDFREVLNKEVM